MRVTTMTLLAVMLGTTIAAHAEPIKIATAAPYAKDAPIADNILRECTTLGTKLSAFTKQFGDKMGLSIVQEATIDTKKGGRVLVIEITGAVSRGSAFTGHSKSVTVQAELFENGVSLASKSFTRGSGGGFFGGHKSACAVLGRCTKALGRDVATWVTTQPQAAATTE